MAINTASFSPKEWLLGIGEETTVGDLASNFLGIETESVSMPSINDMIVMEKKAGSVGRVVNSSDLLSIRSGAIHEISISGVLTTDLLKILVENATGVAEATTGGGTASNSCKIATGHSPAAFAHAATGSGSHNTVSFAINGVSTASSYTLKGCVIEKLNFTADPNEEGGRFKFSLTARTKSPFNEAATSAQTVSAHTENYVFLSDLSTNRSIYGSSDILIGSVDFAIENPVEFLGAKTVGNDKGIPEYYQRAIPLFDTSVTCSVKYDTNTIGFLNSWRDQTVATPSGFVLANHATWASATDFGIKMDDVIISEQPSLDESEYMKYNVVLKSVDDNDTADILDIIVSNQ